MIIEVYVVNGNYLGRFKMPEAAEVCKLIFPFYRNPSHRPKTTGTVGNQLLKPHLVTGLNQHG